MHISWLSHSEHEQSNDPNITLSVYGEGDPLSAEVIIENKLSGTQEDTTENRKIV